MRLKIKRTIFDALMFSYFFIVTAVFIVNPQDDQEKLEAISNLPWLAAFIFLGVGLSFLLNRFGIKTLGEQMFAQVQFKDMIAQKSWLRCFWGWQFLAFLIVSFVIGLQATQFSFTELLDREGFNGAMRLFSGLLHPNMALLPRAVLNIIETIFIAFVATVLAIPVAFVICFFSAKNVMTSKFGFLVYSLLRTILNVVRSIEALIWAIIFSVWVGIGPFAGMLALMIHSIASLAKQYSELVESVSEGPIEGIQSTGATRLQVIWFAIVPQVVLPFISFTVYRWDINVRMATIIGLVGGGGIGTMLIKYQGQAMWPEVGCIILVIAVVVWFMDTASAYLREALK